MNMHYMTRVELHGGTAEDYTKLHGLMEKNGFSRKIQGNNGVSYWLPPAEYVFIGPAGMIQTVKQLAKNAANQVRSNAVLVSEADNVAWEGLEVVKSAPAPSSPLFHSPFFK